MKQKMITLQEKERTLAPMTSSRRCMTSSVLIQRVWWKWKALAADRNLATLFFVCLFVFFFFSLPIPLIFCPPQRGPTMTNKDLVLLVISLIMSMFSSSESRVLNRDFACKIDGYTHVRVQQTFTEPQRLQGSCQLEGGSVSFFWSLFSLDK